MCVCDGKCVILIESEILSTKFIVKLLIVSYLNGSNLLVPSFDRVANKIEWFRYCAINSTIIFVGI